MLNEVENLPQILIMENVTQVHSKKHIHNFDKWCAFLESKGYHNYWQDLEASQYGVPQHRNRTFMVSLLEDASFEFPRTIPLNRVMKDVLDEKVPEKFYISNDKAITVILKNMGSSDTKREPDCKIVDIAAALLSRDYKGLSNYASNGVIEIINESQQATIKRIGNIYGFTGGSFAGNVYLPDGLAPSINTSGGGNREPIILEKSVVN